MNEMQPPQPPAPLPPKSGMGCFARGCLALIIVLVAIVVVGGGGAWWIYSRVVNGFTADRAANVAIDEPAPVVIQQARSRLQQLQDAVRNRTDSTITFSAADLNALIAHEPSFANLRGKVRVNIPGDEMILDLSAPLDTVPLPKFKGRWFNGRSQFGFNYDGTDFFFSARALEANGRRIEASGNSAFTSSFLQSFSSGFTRSFNESFHKGQRNNLQSHEFWDRIKSMSIKSGQLVVETKS